MREFEFDAVVIGSGLAGMTAALDLVTKWGWSRVALVTKAVLGEGAASAWAQGGVAVALPSDDRPELHAQDTLKVGVGLNHSHEVGILTQEGPERVLELVDRGARFDRDEEGQFQFAREAAHCRRRVIHAKDATGAEMVRALVDSLGRVEGVQVFQETFAHRLEVQHGHVAAVVVSGAGACARLRTKAVVLATGGAGQLYAYTTNPAEATADGLALAYRAGARLRDLEFVQFHPTALAVDGEGGPPLPLITEALRGEGAKLVDEKGERFAPLYVPEGGELGPRDQVARAIWFHRREGHRTYLDARHLGAGFAEHFPTVYASCREKLGVDPGSQLIPVVPAAHYHMGGVEVDEWGRTSLAGLWACGEVASTGVHGANRLASNSLLEALVFGARVARDIAAQGAPATSESMVSEVEPDIIWRQTEVDTLVGRRVREIMWERVGLARTQAGLAQAVRQLQALRKRISNPTGEAANMLTVAELVALSALTRTESRGAHHRLDYPETRADWAVHLVVEAGLERPQPVALPQGELHGLGLVS